MNENTMNNDVTMAGESERALLANRYRIIKQLGQGGMGSVWLAEDTQLDGKLFAIKMLPSILVANKRAYAQLKSEALVAMKLVHPNIVQIRAFEENNGNPFLVMDYIDGETLDDYLGDRSQELGVGEEEILKLLKPIAEAIDYAHTEGVVHRDIKPSNVMIRKDGRPFIMDFGIAREIQETMTRVTGKMSSGTLMYMSPEQLNGDVPKPAQDVYSFAAMVYECLKGEPPFSRGNIEYQIMNKEPEPLAFGSSSVPASHVQELGDRCQESGSIASSVMAGLAKKPDDRPKSCVAVLGGAYGNREKKLESGVRSQGSGEAKSQEACERTPEPRGRLFGNITAIILLVFGLAGGIWYWQDSKVKEEARIVAEQKAEAERKAAEEARRIAAEKAKAEKAEAERKQKEEESRIAAEKDAERKAEREVFRLSSKAQSAHDLIDGESSEIKEFFASEIRAFENDCRAGDDAKANSKYVIATNFYAQALMAATALKGSVTKYQECKELLPKIERAKDRADEVNAAGSLPSGYRAAQEAQNVALAAFKAKRFDECKEKIQEAESLFISLRIDVINALLDIAEDHKDNERWDKCKDEAEKVLEWDSNNAKAIVLKNEALQHLVPSLKVIATIDGEEVSGAKLNDGQKDHILPIIWKLERGKKYGPYKVVCESGGKSYEGTFEAVTIDWLGLKSRIVSLKEVNETFEIIEDGMVQLWEGGPYWAAKNIGADKPEDYGCYFWWGDTIGYKRVGEKWVAAKGYNTNLLFSFKNAPTYGKRYGKSILELEREGWIEKKNGTYVLISKHDAAQAHWGGAWRMPTKDEFDDLVSKCEWKWTTRNGKNGYVVRGRGNYASKSIFLPSAGDGLLTSLHSAGSRGSYWSSVPSWDSKYAWNLRFNSGDHGTYDSYRAAGQSVRPVQGFTK